MEKNITEQNTTEKIHYSRRIKCHQNNEIAVSAAKSAGDKSAAPTTAKIKEHGKQKENEGC